MAAGLSFVAGAAAYFVLSLANQKAKSLSIHKPHCGSNKKFKEFLISGAVLAGIKK